MKKILLAVLFGLSLLGKLSAVEDYKPIDTKGIKLSNDKRIAQATDQIIQIINDLVGQLNKSIDKLHEEDKETDPEKTNTLKRTHTELRIIYTQTLTVFFNFLTKNYESMSKEIIHAFFNQIAREQSVSDAFTRNKNGETVCVDDKAVKDGLEKQQGVLEMQLQALNGIEVNNAFTERQLNQLLRKYRNGTL